MKPKLARKARVRRDPRDGRAVLLAPERGLRLSETAEAIVSLCDGTRDVSAIVDDLAARYHTDRLRVAADVDALLTDLYGRALLEGYRPPTFRSMLDPSEDPRAPLTSEDEAPYTLVAELTHRCPLACPYCSNPRQLVRGPEELPLHEWARVIDEAAAMGVMQVHLTGGEPLARSDLEPIASHARSRDLYVNLVTSGMPCDPDRFACLAPFLDHVQLSVQDAEAVASDHVAGTPSYHAKMRFAGWVKDRKLPLTLNVVLHRANLDRVEDVVALAEHLRADRLELANVQLVSWALENATALLPTRAQIEHARDVARAARERLAGTMEVVFVLPDWHADRPRACMDGWGRRFVVVAPDGVVLPCHAARALPLEFQSVRRAPLETIWKHSPAMKAYRGEAWMPDPCRSCDRRGIDYGGCRCQAFALTGDAAATDPACALAPAHSLVARARALAEQRGERHWVYRGR